LQWHYRRKHSRLESKSIDNLIDFSSVIGRANGGSTDGVVLEASAKMDNYITGLSYPTKYFYYSAITLTEVHTALPSQYYQLMQGLDEPNVRELAYKITTNKNYIGYTTVQTTATADNDFYKFNITSNFNATVSISNITTSQMVVSILDSNGTIVGTTHNNSGSTVNFSQLLNPGTYYLKIVSSNPTSTNYTTPYQFIITTTLGINTVTENNTTFYPNPTYDTVFIEGIQYTKATVYSMLGQKLQEIVLDASLTTQQINLGAFESGIYLITLESEGKEQTIKVLKQ